MNSRRKSAFRLLAAGAWIAFGASFALLAAEAADFPAPKFIFVFLANGAGLSRLESARLYNRHVRGEGMVISDRILNEGSSGLMTMHSADSLVTDSAARSLPFFSGLK